MRLLLIFVIIASVPSWANADWPAFRGDGTSHAPPGDYPLHWSPDANLAWIADPVGFGQSAPVVFDDLVYITSIVGPRKETNIVSAYRLATGELAWYQEFASSAPAENTRTVARAAPTAIARDDGVVAFFESGDLYALDRDGEVRWQRSLTHDYGPFLNPHGVGSSPAQWNSSIFVLIDQESDGYLIALDQSTGQTLWKVDRPDRSGWSSPVVATLCGEPQLIVGSSGAVESFDLATGELLWEQHGFAGNSIPSPTIDGNDLYLGARLGRRAGDISAVARSNCRLTVARKGGAFSVTTEWESSRVLSHYASPVIAGGHVLYSNKVGVLYALRMDDGRVTARVRTGGPCMATPLVIDDRIYLFQDDGTTKVYQIGEQLSELATSHLWEHAGIPVATTKATRPKEPVGTKAEEESDEVIQQGEVVYGIAASDGSILIRTGTRLFCVRKRHSQSK